MKKLLIPLLSLSTIGTIATATSCSCTFGREQDKLDPLSIDYLDIRDNILYGFKDQYKYIESIPEGNYKLSIPKDVQSLDNVAFNLTMPALGDAMLVIKALDYEKDCACTSLGLSAFSGCTNIEKVVLPPKLNSWGVNLFTACPKLTSIDLTNLTQAVAFESWNAPASGKRWSTTGTITYLKDNNNQKDLANKLLAAINFTGSDHNWALEAK